MELKYLTGVSLELIQECLQESFLDYPLDLSYMTVEVMRHRNLLCRNSPECSVGAFDKGKMIGFLNVGVDELNGELVGFDGGTGVVKAYRGQGLAGKMLEKSVKALKVKGAKKFKLEVLQSNKPAIRAYEKEGFSILHNYKCYGISISDYRRKEYDLEGVSIKQISCKELEENWHFIKYPVSWEQMLAGLKLVENEIIINAAYKENECIGFVVYSPALCWITGVGVKQNSVNETTLLDYLIGDLFEKINPVKPMVSVNNILEEDRLNGILLDLGFKNTFDQYEMFSQL